MDGWREGWMETERDRERQRETERDRERQREIERERQREREKREERREKREEGIEKREREGDMTPMAPLQVDFKCMHTFEGPDFALIDSFGSGHLAAPIR